MSPLHVGLSLLLVALVGAGCGISGSAATSPDGQLTSAMPEPAGEHCANGGVRVQSGLDVDADEVLDDDEIESVEYVCAPAIPTLVREDRLEPGAACPSGGVALFTGRDLDRDGVLDDAEVEHAVNVCDASAVWTGDLRTSEWSSPEARAALGHVRAITGKLVVDDGAALPALELVARDVELTAEVPSILFPALTHVAGGLMVSSSVVRGVSLPRLEGVGGSLVLDWTASDAFVAAPALERIGADLKLLVGQEAAVRLPALREIGGALLLDGKPAALDLPALETIGGALRIYLDAPAVDLPAVTTLGGDLDLSTFHVRTIELPLLQGIGGDVSVRNAPVLATLNLRAVATVAGELQIAAPALSTLELGALAMVGEGIWIGTTGLTAVRLPSLGQARSLSVQLSPNVTEVSAPELENVRDLGLFHLPMLATIGFGKLARVTGDLVIVHNDALASLAGLAALTSVGGSVNIRYNSQLPPSEVASLKARLGKT